MFPFWMGDSWQIPLMQGESPLQYVGWDRMGGCSTVAVGRLSGAVTDPLALTQPGAGILWLGQISVLTVSRGTGSAQ